MTLFQEIVISSRFLISRPGYTLAAILTLALGIGADVSIYSVYHAVLLQPLPLVDPDRLVSVAEGNVARGVTYGACSQRTYTELVKRGDVFSGVTAFYPRIANLGGLEEPLTVMSWQTDAAFFSTLGLRLAAGRAFRAEETRPGSPSAVAVLGNGLWRREFGSDPAVIGRIIRLDDIPVTIIGVMPQAEAWLDADLLVPLQPIVTDFQSRRMLGVVARMRPGITVEHAAVMVQSTSAALAEEFPPTHGGWGVVLRPFTDSVVGADTRRLLLLMGCAVAVVFVVACANLTNLLLARAVGRRHEIAIHSALGAGRMRLARRMLTESVMLAVAGGCAGLLVALWAVDLFRAFGTGQVPRIDRLALGWHVLGFAAVISLFAGMAVGFVPALHVSGAAPIGAMKGAGSGTPGCSDRHGLRSMLVVAQIALSIALLTGAILVGRSVLLASRVDPGLEVTNRFAVTVNLPPTSYPTSATVIEFWRTLFTRLEAVPGVKNAAATSDRWLLAGRRVVEYDVEGQEGVNRRVPAAELRTVTPGYFRTLGIPVIKGRVFDNDDRGAADSLPHQQGEFVVVVSKTLAARQWPGEDAIGKRIRPNVGNTVSYWSTVIGIVDDIRQSALAERPVPTVYLPEYQYAWRRMFLLIQADGTPASVLPSVCKAITEMDPRLPVDDVVSLDSLKYQSLSLGRSVTFVLLVFAVIAVFLAAVGVYSVIGYSVACRKHEFGIRIAVGANSGDIVRLVLRRGIRLALIGEGIGIILAFALGISLRTMLFEISPVDPLTHACVAVFVLAVALTACLVPAWRAARIDPVRALRTE